MDILTAVTTMFGAYTKLIMLVVVLIVILIIYFTYSSGEKTTKEGLMMVREGLMYEKPHLK